MVRTCCSVFAFVLMLLAATLQMRVPAHAEKRPPLVVVVSHAIGMTDISLATLRRVFQAEHAAAPDGKPLVALNAPLRSYERELFDRRVLGLGPEEVSRFWITRRIRGEGLPPRTLPTVDLGVRVVVSYPGAIAYVGANLVSRGVQVLTIDGNSPSDPGYLFEAR